MGRLSMWPAVMGVALAMILVNLVQPTASSLSYAGGIVVLLCLLGWVMEAREIAGPAPAVEPEHEEEEEAPGPSYWPLLLAIGIVAIGAGLVYDWQYGGLIIAVPMALGAGAAWGKLLKEEMTAAAPSAAEAMAAPAIMSGGRLLLPVSGQVLATQAAGGAAIALEMPRTRQVSRRGVLRLAFWTGLGAGLAGLAGSLIDFLYPRGITGFGSVISAGTVEQFAPGSKTGNAEGKFWLVNLTAEQGGPGFLALWWKCPHLGCTVPWRSEFVFPDPANGQDKRGWFRCPCHGSTYDDAGVRVFGPAPRSLDRMQVTIDPSSKRISVNTGVREKGTPDNAKFAVKS